MRHTRIDHAMQSCGCERVIRVKSEAALRRTTDRLTDGAGWGCMALKTIRYCL